MLLATACAPAAAPPEPARPVSPCVLTGDSSERLSVALGAMPDPARAPVPSSAAERVVFRQLYETLVTLDCEGRIVPGLAERWSAEEQGRAWRFVLRMDASFTDGAAVTPLDVIRAWSAATLTAPRAAALLSRMEATGARELRVELHHAVDDAALFAAPAFAVARVDPGSSWPAGTGAYRVGDAEAPSPRLVPRDAALPVLDFVPAPDDGRNAVDAGIDIVTTADPATLDYARALPGRSIAPLGWTRGYVLATRASAQTPPAAALDAIARDAVRADARATVIAPCRSSQPPRPAIGSGTASIAYPRDDAAARAIAERLVALAWPAAAAPLWLRELLGAYTAAPAATALDARALAASLRSAGALAYIVPLAPAAGDACVNLALDAGPLADALAASRLHVVPLIDVREYVIRRGTPGGASIDGDGVLRFTRRP